ncbi:hypothetical protein ACOMHN_010368 [Nucella lapillus]
MTQRNGLWRRRCELLGAHKPDKTFAPETDFFSVYMGFKSMLGQISRGEGWRADDACDASQCLVHDHLAKCNEIIEREGREDWVSNLVPDFTVKQRVERKIILSQISRGEGWRADDAYDASQCLVHDHLAKCNEIIEREGREDWVSNLVPDFTVKQRVERKIILSQISRGEGWRADDACDASQCLVHDHLAKCNEIIEREGREDWVSNLVPDFTVKQRVERKIILSQISRGEGWRADDACDASQCLVHDHLAKCNEIIEREGREDWVSNLVPDFTVKQRVERKIILSQISRGEGWRADDACDASQCLVHDHLAKCNEIIEREGREDWVSNLVPDFTVKQHVERKIILNDVKPLLL